MQNLHQNHQQRTAIAGETLDDQGQDLNHSAKDIHADGSGADFVQALNAKRGKLNLPPAGAKEQWEKLDEELVLKLNALIGNSTLEHKLDTYGDIIYSICRDTYGVKQPKTKTPPQKSRRQQQMESIRREKRKLKKRMKTASEFEKQGLLELWKDLKAKHNALSKVESARRRKSKKKKTQDRFFKDPFDFARKLFEQPKSGTLTVGKETLEQHLRETYSDSQRKAPLEIQDLLRPALPEKLFNNKPRTLDKVKKVVGKARAKSTPGLTEYPIYCTRTVPVFSSGFTN